MATPSAAAQLRALLNQPGPALILGAHDALSAKLAEQAGFDAVWGSGFGISAVNALPDANLLTMSETIDAFQRMVEAIHIPVVADCDNGFGNAINVIRTVAQCERAGVAGLCIEDNVFPKRCSFYTGVQRELVPIEEHVRKIQAARVSRQDPDFVIIARTEALIAGWGKLEALKRAHAYAAAGADAVLVHSKSSTIDELKDFAKSWDSICPLVAVPTTYTSITARDLTSAGFKLVIFANQALRAAVKAMKNSLAVLKLEARPSAVDDRIATLSEIYELVGVPDLQANEQKFLVPSGHNVTAVITSTGFEESFLPLTEDHKEMLAINGKAILERQIRILSSCGVKDIAVVSGYSKEHINLSSVRCYQNDRFCSMGKLVSLFLAQSETPRRFLFQNSDIIFEPSVLEKLLKSEADVSVVVDRAWGDHPHSQEEIRTRRPTLVVTHRPPQKGYRFLPKAERTTVARLGRLLPPGEADGEFIGLAIFSDKGARLLHAIYGQSQQRFRNRQFHEAEAPDKASFTDMLQEIIDCGGAVACVDIYKGWLEIDTFEDYCLE